ncbi:hypothetical protein HMPREF0373_02963 [Eubacterium ramulus ATCC 29099]|uniref:Uncharacterized protein n=1 Tax=Eubacterium ramulus ATCC 29099 TaxID=1256908 RepID=U2PF20_EUBRA|nr:hypothetical protein HMPREF0373_02963 [Eubacterium ramulus ATCC 29099]
MPLNNDEINSHFKHNIATYATPRWFRRGVFQTEQNRKCYSVLINKKVLYGIRT